MQTGEVVGVVGPVAVPTVPHSSERETAVTKETKDAILAAHRKVVNASRKTLLHARECGELLKAIKAQVKHGHWLEWLRRECPEIEERTAQRYLTLAKHWDKIPETDTKSEMAMRDALTAINEARRATPNPAREERQQRVMADLRSTEVRELEDKATELESEAKALRAQARALRRDIESSFKPSGNVM